MISRYSLRYLHDKEHLGRDKRKKNGSLLVVQNSVGCDLGNKTGYDLFSVIRFFAFSNGFVKRYGFLLFEWERKK